jgi:hypothetical protein
MSEKFCRPMTENVRRLTDFSPFVRLLDFGPEKLGEPNRVDLTTVQRPVQMQEDLTAGKCAYQRERKHHYRKQPRRHAPRIIN